jgi:hypothetical protein
MFCQLTLPADGTYTARVMHYGETSGEYDLTLSPGFARLAYQQSFDDPALVWVAPGSGTAVVDQGRLRLRAVGETASAVAVAPDVQPLADHYYEASARLFASPSYAEFGLVFARRELPRECSARTSFASTARAGGRSCFRMRPACSCCAPGPPMPC